MKEIILKIKNCDANITKSLSGYNNLNETMLIEVVPLPIIEDIRDINKKEAKTFKEFVNRNIKVKQISNSVKDGFELLISVKDLSQLELADLLKSEIKTISFERGK